MRRYAGTQNDRFAQFAIKAQKTSRNCKNRPANCPLILLLPFSSWTDRNTQFFVYISHDMTKEVCVSVCVCVSVFSSNLLLIAFMC